MPERLTTDISLVDLTFGVQIDAIVDKHSSFLAFPYHINGIGEQFPELRGHEMAMVKMLGRAAVERIQLMDDLGSGGLAREIVEARRETFIKWKGS